MKPLRHSTLVVLGVAVMVAALTTSELTGEQADGAEPNAPTGTDTEAGSSEPMPRGSITGTASLEVPGALVEPNLSRTVVYLASDPVLDPPHPSQTADAPPPPISKRPEIVQRDRAFQPDLLVVPIGTYVEFPNWDRFSHNVFSRSPAAPPFDLERYEYGRSKTYRFVALGVVQVFCNIHPNMRATVVVTPNEHFTRADRDGRFTLPDVPSGEYELVTWHPRAAEHRQKVVVTDGQRVELELVLEPGQSRPASTEHRQRRESGGVTRGLGVNRQRLNVPTVQECHPAWPGPNSPESEQRERHDDEAEN